VTASLVLRRVSRAPIDGLSNSAHRALLQPSVHFPVQSSELREFKSGLTTEVLCAIVYELF
jgi:hypothetical protein